MTRLRLPAKGLAVMAVLVALLALSLMPMLVTAAGSKAEEGAYNKAVMQVTIALTSKGIVATPSALKPGNHLLIIKNNTSEPRGIEMIGIDQASSPTVRYTTILKPGKTEQFRWYFAQGNTAFIRDVMNRTHTKTGFTTVTFGHMAKAVWVK